MKLPFINQRAIIFAIGLGIIFLFWFAANPGVSAQGRLPKPSGHVNDFAEVLDAPTRQRLEKILENLKERTGIDFVIATVKSSGAEDLYDYSLRIANDWNIGVQTSPKKTVLLAIAGDPVARAKRPAADRVVRGLIREWLLRLETGNFEQNPLTPGNEPKLGLATP